MLLRTCVSKLTLSKIKKSCFLHQYIPVIHNPFFTCGRKYMFGMLGEQQHTYTVTSKNIII